MAIDKFAEHEDISQSDSKLSEHTSGHHIQPVLHARVGIGGSNQAASCTLNQQTKEVRDRKHDGERRGCDGRVIGPSSAYHSSENDIVGCRKECGADNQADNLHYKPIAISSPLPSV